MTLLIKGVRVFCGNRTSDDPVDIFVSGDKISAIGNFSRKKADTVLDGQDLFLAPGFIDADTETDHYLELFSHPEQGDFVQQGITTIVGGQEGSSLAPLLYGSLEALEEWTNPDKLNIDWRNIAELFAHFVKHPLGVNFGTFVGHSTIRRALIGEHLRDLTKNELAVFEQVLREALDQGAMGLSVNLKSVYGRKTPYAELNRLAGIIRERGGAVSVALRKATGVSKAVDEVLKLCRESGARTVISNFLPIEGQREEYEQALQKIEALDDATPLYFDVAPFETNVRPLYRFLPDWAQTGSLDDMAAHMEDEWLKPRLIKDFPELKPEEFRVARARHNETVVGYSLRDIMELYGIKQPTEALYKLMQTTKLRALIAYRNVDRQTIARALCHPRSLIASKGVSFAGRGREKTWRPDGHASAFPSFVDTVTGSELMPLGTAIRKIATAPAAFFGLAGRGSVTEGVVADLVLFSYAEKRMTIKAVIVNGRIAARDGALTGACAGTPVRRHGKS